jgi:hypothetical protein
MKLCKDCKHVKLGEAAHDSSCTHPNNTGVHYHDLVFGERTIWYRQTPSKLREDNWLDSVFNRTCGKPGRWFELKPIECDIFLEDGKLTLTRID